MSIWIRKLLIEISNMLNWWQYTTRTTRTMLILNEVWEARLYSFWFSILAIIAKQLEIADKCWVQCVHTSFVSQKAILKWWLGWLGYRSGVNEKLSSRNSKRSTRACKDLVQTYHSIININEHIIHCKTQCIWHLPPLMIGPDPNLDYP